MGNICVESHVQRRRVLMLRPSKSKAASGEPRSDQLTAAALEEACAQACFAREGNTVNRSDHSEPVSQ
jgi:hypothetical protein